MKTNKSKTRNVLLGRHREVNLWDSLTKLDQINERMFQKTDLSLTNRTKNLKVDSSYRTIPERRGRGRRRREKRRKTLTMKQFTPEVKLYVFDNSLYGKIKLLIILHFLFIKALCVCVYVLA